MLQLKKSLLSGLALAVACTAPSFCPAQTVNQAQQAYREGRFPDLVGQTETSKIFKICERERGSDVNLCIKVADIMRTDVFNALKTQEQQKRQIDDVRAAEIRKTLSGKVAMDSFDNCLAPRRGTQGNKSLPECVAVAEQAAGESIEREKRAEAEKIREAKLATERFNESVRQKEKDDMRDECLASKAHKLADAAYSIRASLAGIEGRKKDIQFDKDAERISGVINLTLRQKSGQLIVLNQKNIELRFAEYKSLGGTATAPEKIAETTSPCGPLGIL